MATQKQKDAAKTNIKKAQEARWIGLAGGRSGSTS